MGDAQISERGLEDVGGWIVSREGQSDNVISCFFDVAIAC